MKVSDYTELKVYALAFEGAMRIFELSKRWPAEERYALTDQIRRSSRSVCGNLAEAWRKRPYVAHFVSKLSDSSAEAAETEVWLSFALRCGYLRQADHDELQETYDHIARMLTRMMRNPAPWHLSKSETARDEGRRAKGVTKRRGAKSEERNSTHAPRSSLHAPRSSLLAPRSSLLAPRSSPHATRP